MSKSINVQKVTLAQRFLKIEMNYILWAMPQLFP